MTNKKWFPKACFIVTFVVIILIICLSLLYQIARCEYWSTSQLDGVQIVEMKNVSAEKEKLNDTIEIVKECNKVAISVPEECDVFFKECNGLVINYFNQTYSVDVSEKLETLQVMQSTYPGEIANEVGGSYITSVPELKNKIFINHVILDEFVSKTKSSERSVYTEGHFAIKMLRTIYIHEVIHYLGFNGETIFDHFIEGITESLTQQVIEFNGITYEDVTGYGKMKELATQIIMVDSEIVLGVFEDSNFSIGKHFDEVLGDGFAKQLDDLTYSVQKENGEEECFFAQYIVNEYVKCFTESIPQIIDEKTICPGFELKWYLVNNNCSISF